MISPTEEEMKEMLLENARQLSFDEALREQAAKDCVRLANLVKLMDKYLPEDKRHVVVLGDGKTMQISLGDLIDGHMALHEHGEGQWW